MSTSQSEVMVFGAWGSAFCTRVELALKLKGINYEYVLENLPNKSDSLLSYNPVHKKVPVLVHKGKPIAESLVILEYIDDCWNHSPKLLPHDPHERAKVRFWANFHDNKIWPCIFAIMYSKGKEHQDAVKELSDLLTVLEEGMKKDFSTKFPLKEGPLDFLDIVVGSFNCNYKALEEAFSIVAIDPEKHLLFLSWMNALKEYPLVNETLPPHDKLVARLGQVFHQAQI